MKKNLKEMATRFKSKSLKEKAVDVGYIIASIIILWIVLSVGDVMIHNEGGNGTCNYAWWNLFLLILKIKG